MSLSQIIQDKLFGSQKVYKVKMENEYLEESERRKTFVVKKQKIVFEDKSCILILI